MPVVLATHDYLLSRTLIFQEDSKKQIHLKYLNEDNTSGTYVNFANFEDFMVTCDFFNKFKEEYMKQNQMNEPRRKIEIPE